MESVTKHDTSSLKLQGQRSPLHAIQLGCSRGWQQLRGPGSRMKKHAIWSTVMPHRHADSQRCV